MAKQKPKPKRKAVTYTPEIGAAICERIGMCQSLRSICKGSGMPSLRTVMNWQRTHEDFALALDRAREHRADARVEAISDYAEQVRTGKLDYNAGRVAIDALKWLASKEQPRKYGDRIVSEVAVKVGVHTEQPSDTLKWIERVLAGEDRTNVVPLLPMPRGSAA